MKKALLFILLACPLLSQTERSTFLRAINMVENPTNSSKPGRRGELGPYQFMPSTWHQHTSAPFSSARDFKASNSVAIMHYEWISSELKRRGIPANDYNIAKSWNMGVTAVVNRRRSSDYPQRVVNLCRSMSGEIYASR